MLTNGRCMELDWSDNKEVEYSGSDVDCVIVTPQSTAPAPTTDS